LAYTALQVVNKILARVGEVAGDTTAITAFTDTAHQRAIDVALQALNELIHEMYGLECLQGEAATGTITLVSGSAGREYALPSDFIQFAGKTYETRVLVDQTNRRILYEYPGGWERMFADQLNPDDYTGPPGAFAINKSNDKIRVDANPDTTNVGDVFTFLYDKRVTITAITDTFPFNDQVADALIAGIAEVWRVIIDRDTRESAYASLGFRRAIRLLRQTKPAVRYGVRRA
jgi:hypothetical protein